MSLYTKIRGTIESIFQIGLAGPNLKNNSGVIEARNAADSGFAIVRGASPVGNDDLVTKAYADTLNKPFVVADQFDGNDPLPSNTGTEQFFIVSTTGGTASIGDLIWDDGSGVGTAVVLPAQSGRSVFTAAAFTGGTVTFAATVYYAWDGSVWIQESNLADFSGAVREIRFAINNTNGAQDSAALVPANAVIVAAELDIATPYSGGATITLGRAGSATLLQATTDNLATVANRYSLDLDTAWGGSALAVRATIAGAPAAGAGFAIVRFTVPNA